MPDEAPKPEDMNEGELERAFTDAAKSAPEAQPEQTTPPAPPSEPAPAGPSPLFEKAQQLGIDTDGVESDEQLLEKLYGQYQQSQPYVQYAQQLLPYQDQIREILSKQQEPEQPRQPEEEWTPQKYFQEKWQAPKFDPAWQALIDKGMITTDPETGMYVPAKGFESVVSPDIVRGIGQYMDFQRKALNELFQNPYERTWDAFQEPLQRTIQQQVDDRIRQMLGYQSEQSAILSYEQEHLSELYEVDDQGQVIYDLQQNPKLTAYGEAFVQEVSRLRDAGLSAGDILRYAEAAASPLKKQPAQAAQSQSAPAPPEKKESFMQEAMNKASHSPNGGAYAEAEEVPVNIRSRQELENMFVDAARKTGL